MFDKLARESEQERERETQTQFAYCFLMKEGKKNQERGNILKRVKDLLPFSE
jgi:hypothetical protein